MELAGKNALEAGMQGQLLRAEEKKERERLAVAAEKAAIKAAKKPKKEVTEEVEH